jgi:hypothetical protein
MICAHDRTDELRVRCGLSIATFGRTRSMISGNFMVSVRLNAKGFLSKPSENPVEGHGARYNRDAIDYSIGA